jgi:hypothetical protein
MPPWWAADRPAPRIALNAMFDIARPGVPYTVAPADRSRSPRARPDLHTATATPPIPVPVPALVCVNLLKCNGLLQSRKNRTVIECAGAFRTAMFRTVSDGTIANRQNYRYCVLDMQSTAEHDGDEAQLGQGIME